MEKKFTDFQDDYTKLIGQTVGIDEYNKTKFGVITSVTKTGFKTDVLGYSEKIFRFDDGRLKGESYGNAKANLFTEEEKENTLIEELKTEQRNKNIRFIKDYNFNYLSYEKSVEICKILNS